MKRSWTVSATVFFSSILLLSAYSVPLTGESFSFRYEAGEKYRILSTVDEEVYINGEFSHRADILNKIAVTVEKAESGTGQLSVLFQTSERAFGQNDATYHWAEDYQSRFLRDARGVYTIHPDYYMPVLRDVPVFPERNLAPGDTWVSRAEEVHDLRRVFNLQDAFHIPVTVAYEYTGAAEFEGKRYDLILVEYTIFYKPRQPQRYNALFPVLISGYSKQKLYWDAEKGRPHYSVEDFDLLWELASGERVEYSGTAEGRVVESARMDRTGLASDIRKTLEEAGIGDATVAAEDRGVTITLENVQFLPDSAVLLAREKLKLERIGEILKKYPDRDILVTGHTALAGTPDGRQQLSAERAKAVGDYLLETGVTVPEQMIYRGMGAQEPVADNSTEAGRRKNRRVEITILEN